MSDGSKIVLDEVSGNKDVSNPSGSISSEQVGSFSQGEMQALRRLMAQADSSPTITSTYFAHTSITANAFTASSSVPWIIDSGASDHMTGCSSVFDSYLPCSGKDKVRIADGSFSAISGKGTENGEGDW
ncbi:uncharacterized protein LOC130792540 [Actinidia eriantha]|uniref:uncharacterized protein LOC130765782 n=1 Tax=Actinidia eriantha TaxID=165200 RepID=UPI002588894A|nr:uncharacterized protein LOC130765782 [Actinidia eriantha]XP_057494073.1 uncharacterized protein LOC130779441 [Actinidia eriantha]XP_057500100.1 uncharacterized protein LOC130784286 [Actinidia eriantha]XP_057508359.1 uncharacterized protein LOC130791233 [Actinidia eriantha]XP_057510048.1 uncharacterized protein LOC130792540 [Actinidia eriantha]